jgi:hypothetical protein
VSTEGSPISEQALSNTFKHLECFFYQFLQLLQFFTFFAKFETAKTPDETAKTPDETAKKKRDFFDHLVLLEMGF